MKMTKISLKFHCKNKGKSHIAVFDDLLINLTDFRVKTSKVDGSGKIISDGNFSDRLTFFEKLFQEIISKRRCVICLCFYNEKSMKFWLFSWNPHFSHFFTKKSEKCTFWWKVHFFAKKSEKCTFSWKSPKSALFRSFRAPCENVALANGILMVLGAIFSFRSKKCTFWWISWKGALFWLFSEKAHFSHFFAKSAHFAPKGDFWPKSAIWEPREPPEGSRDRPRGKSRGVGGGVPGDPSESGPGEKTLLYKAKRSKDTACHPSCI